MINDIIKNNNNLIFKRFKFLNIIAKALTINHN